MGASHDNKYSHSTFNLFRKLCLVMNITFYSLSVYLQLSDAMTTLWGHHMLLGRHMRSRTRDGWWSTAPVWEKEVDASHAPPEVRIIMCYLQIPHFLHESCLIQMHGFIYMGKRILIMKKKWLFEKQRRQGPGLEKWLFGHISYTVKNSSVGVISYH